MTLITLFTTKLQIFVYKFFVSLNYFSPERLIIFILRNKSTVNFE